MDTPICLSHFFVNKQNVRSFRNIIDVKILKSEDDADFFKHLLGGEFSISDLPQELHSVITTLKLNLRSKSKQDFVGYFNVDKSSNLYSVSKEEIFISCYKALCDIIPKNFFGINHNSKIFKNMIHTIIYSMKGQHMFVSKIINKWDISVNPWKFLQNCGENCIDEARRILNNILVWIVKYILSAMLSLNFHATTCKLDANEYKLHFFWKNQWQSFYDKKISNMIFTKVIKKFEPYCLGKKFKRKQSLSERLKLRTLKKDIPKLHLVLKSSNDCRPIVRYKSEPPSVADKYKMKERLKLLKMLNGKPAQKLENQFSTVYQAWLKSNKPKLYFVKTDLSNAFGSISKEKLMKIICELHLNYQKAEKNVYMKKKIAQQYKDLIVELRKPLLVRAGSTVFEWKEGLVQGYKYSPALSELYYTHMDGIYFSDLLKKGHHSINLFIRVVDDYLYITDSLEDAKLFLKSLSSYRNVNYEKTVINFSHENFKMSQEMTFLGYSYNTSTLEVSRANNVYIGQMCYKIAFTSAISQIGKFFENRIGQSGIQINGHIFNLNYDCEEIIWKHIFTTFCLSANKFCTILAILCEEKEMGNYLMLYKKRVTVKLSNAIIETLTKNKPKDYVFMFCINHFRYLSWLALCLCAKKTPKCNGLVPLVNVELAKTNCIFSKWREHSSRIDSNGDCIHGAIKEVCRRTDLRAIVKQFATLPSGFECFHHKQLN